MKKFISSIAVLFGTIAMAGASHVFVTPASATSNTAGTDLWPASNLVQGPGVGYDAAGAHDQLGGGATHRWVTDDPGGFPSDYIAVAGAPVIVLDLGGDIAIDRIHTWGYAGTNSNGVSEFSLRFATEADGLGGFGTSIGFNPLFNMVIDELPIQTNTFGQVLTARYVEFTALDNFFVAPGDGSGGEVPGGDRVGLGEIAFGIPEPSISLLGVIGLAGLAMRRRRG